MSALGHRTSPLSRALGERSREDPHLLLKWPMSEFFLSRHVVNLSFDFEVNTTVKHV